MSRRVAFLAVAILLCIVLSSQAADVLQCTGERLNNGSFFFSASYDFEDVHDCETQWLVEEKLIGYCEAGGNPKFDIPIMMATANTAILQTCPEKLQCGLICPSGNINEKKPCTCGTTPPTPFPKVSFPDWRTHVGIGVSCGLFVLILAIGIVLYFRRRSRYSHCATDPAQDSV